MPARYQYSEKIPTFRKLAMLLPPVAIAYAIEVRFDLNEALDEFLESYEHYNADAVFIGSYTLLVTLLILKISDWRREARRRRAAEEQALQMAYHDPLTGLGNRRKLERTLIDLAPGEMRAVMMMDLDDFKPVNDIFGHAAGDDVLRDAARRLSGICGEEALVCRFGGDEFAILTRPLKEREEAEQLAQRAAQVFEKQFSVGSAESRVGISLGVALHVAGEHAVEDSIRHADVALYRAKEDHHCTFKFYEPAMDEELRRRKTLEQKLRKAIESGAVEPFFQPLVKLNSSELIGFEALARWTDPDFGPISPVEFIELAEKSGLITQLSEYLLRRACREAMHWPTHLRLSFNLSPQQLRDRLIGLRILAILGETGLAPSRLELEVTEGSLVEDKELARELLNGLRAAGVRIAIDDFGTGYSSLYHLLEFKFDNLKIDRHFVDTMQEGGEKAVIVDAVLALSRGLGLTATAEGIEDESQLAKLVKSGCELGQGYYFGRAMSAADVLTLIGKLSEPERAVG